ncbi:type II toxin-antitoxin system HicB family antitoxin [Catalinimonas niigatensis]|uniref:type II toxin-antitoxin system HicB family antitoxin n=1 Tax=Catalinimonas niigatensis TaxID=1397264 RepID=UPI00266652E4|nr:type II toxin-antitoxin system HicB family antitoxin [Catalinimonas niigatensis]WPP52959.1 type II toxin-antitoxin system HicB family antitoxin [Catalinimonas niigatensis]
MRKYLIVYEKSKDGYSAYVPDLGGCTSAGATREEVEANIIEAINLYIETLKEDGLPIPEAFSYGENLVFHQI